MDLAEFNEEYKVFAKRAITLAEKARREGLLSLENDIIKEKYNQRDIFDYGLRFTLDGNDYDFIDELLSNIINQEKDYYTLQFKKVEKEAVLAIQSGLNPYYAKCMINSHTHFTLIEDEIFSNDIAKGGKNEF